MSTWIKTNTYDLASRRGKATTPKKKFHIMLSPYDVPNAVRTVHNNKCLTIELRYIKIEESRQIFTGDDDGISFEIGLKTKRIYKVFLDNDRFKGDEVNILLKHAPIESAIDRFISSQESLDANTAKYSAAQSVIKNYGEPRAASI